MTHRDISFTEPGHRSIGSLWLVLDGEDRALVVNPNRPGATGGTGHYRLPGGGAEAAEAPHLAAVRAGHGEVGLTMIPDTLLVTDYVTADEETGAVEGLVLVFLHRLRAGDRIVLNARNPSVEPGLLDFMLLDEDELDKHCRPHEARRIRAAMEAAADPSARGYRFEGQALDDNAA